MTTDPSTITGISYRYRAGSITGLGDAATVTTWSDTSGNGYTATPPTNAPAAKFYSNQVNGLPIVRWDSTLGVRLVSNAPSSFTAFTFFVVHKLAGTGTRAPVGSSAAPGLEMAYTSAGNLQIVRQATSIPGVATTATATTAFTVDTASWDTSGGAYAFYSKGTANGSGTRTGVALGTGLTLFIGTNGSATETYVGDIAELIMYSRVLTTSERAAVHSYIQDTYAITVSDYTAGTPDTTAPTVPGTPTATAGNASASVAFAASTDAVGVTGYRVYSSADSYTAVAATGATSPVTVTGLTNGTAYTFQVAAYDAAGNQSAKSATSNSVTPANVVTVPGAPTGLAATAGNASAALSWTAPASNGGAAISDYLVEYQPSGGSWTTFTHTAQTTTTITVTGLTNGTAYSFRVSAINSAGTSTASSTATATPATGPTVILPTDTNIVYSPYNWNTTSVRAQTVNSGAYLRTTFQGTPTAITANFDTTGTDGSATLAIRVDNEPVVTATRAATITITIPSNGWTKHTVEITVVSVTGNDLWNTPTSTVKFTGFTVTPGTVTTTTTRRRPYNVLCMGDSITNGYSTTTAFIIDGRLNWAYPLRDYLAAEVGVVGFNAQGFSSLGSANVPFFGSTYNLMWTGVSRSFTTPTEPDLIIINQGTNDGGANNTTTMTTVLNGLLAATTNTKIVVLQQWNGTSQRTFWQNAIAASTSPSRITYLDTSGWFNSADAGDGLHPWGYINLTDLSPRVAASAKALLVAAGTPVTPKRFVNVGGVAKAIA